MVKKNNEKIINNDEFPPLPPSPTLTDSPTPKGTRQETESVWNTVRRKTAKSISLTKKGNSLAEIVTYVKTVKPKTANSPKRPKPASPTDHGSVSFRKLNNDVKIKQEYIDGVDTTKGLAPIIGTTSPSAKNDKTATRVSSRHKDDKSTLRQSRQNSQGRDRGSGRGGRGKILDKSTRSSTSMKLRSIVEYNDGNTKMKELKENIDDDDKEDDDSDDNSMKEDNDGETSTQTEIIANMATRMRIKHGIPEDENSISSSDVPSSSDDESTDEPNLVTPNRQNGDVTNVDTPRLGNMYGLMSILSPTTKKSEGDAK